MTLVNTIVAPNGNIYLLRFTNDDLVVTNLKDATVPLLQSYFKSEDVSEEAKQVIREALVNMGIITSPVKAYITIK